MIGTTTPNKIVYKGIDPSVYEVNINKRKMRGYIAEYSGRGLPPPMFVVSVELSFFCHRHVICTLDHIYIDFH